MPTLKHIAAFILMGLTVPVGATNSQLWGTNGERWTPESRLPDFSYAGYHCGDKPAPDVPTGVSVKGFGAKGDGVTDDTAAFLQALAEAKGAIEIPPGRYVLTNILEINRPGIVLRGAGPGQTTLFFPRPLQEIRPHWSATTTGRKTSDYSWAGGFVWFKGHTNDQVLAKVVAKANRGEKMLELSTTMNLQASQRIEIFQKDNPDNSLAMEMYSGDAGDIENLHGSSHASLVCRITRIEGHRIYFDRPLRLAIRTEWHPQIRDFNPGVTEAGVENLRFEFPDVPYPGHFNERGYNAVAFSITAADCWARNLVISNADGGIFSDGRFCTMQNIIIDSGRAADEASLCTGHHAFDFIGEDNLLTGFDCRTKFIHDLTVEHCAAGNVIANGRGVDLCFDHHVCAPYENLYTDIDAGAGTRLWFCGGGSGLGKHSGARETFWNIRAARAQKFPPADFGPPSMNFVAVQTDLPSENSTNHWLEAISPADIVPRDLHAAQLARRRQAK